MLQLHLRDINPEVTAALDAAFIDEPAVTVSQGDILATSADAIVSPANSFGYMDGGIDLLYSRYFGYGLEGRLRQRLREEHYGELPVGQAVVMATGHEKIPFLVSAPTMRVPDSISRTVNVYLACRAALIAVLAHNATGAKKPIATLLAPGLGTGVGDMPPVRAARQMRLAWDAIVHGHGQRERNAGQIWGEQFELLN